MLQKISETRNIQLFTQELPPHLADARDVLYGGIQYVLGVADNEVLTKIFHKTAL